MQLLITILKYSKQVWHDSSHLTHDNSSCSDAVSLSAAFCGQDRAAICQISAWKNAADGSVKPEMMDSTLCLPWHILRQRYWADHDISGIKQHTFRSTSCHVITSTIHCVSKKVPTFKLSVTFLSNVNGFSKFLHRRKTYKICYKTHRHYPSHFRHVTTLPWKLKMQIFCRYSAQYRRKCKQITFLSPLPFLFIHKFWYFQCLK